jgi:hypothetical protein
MPLFSVFIPATGRPQYARDAAFSVMNQNFDDFDVTFSNNGADPAVKTAVAEFTADPRFHYLEQPNVLNMPTHWETASRGLVGDYFLVLTDRCVLKQGVLRRLSTLFKSHAGAIEIINWRGETYDNASGLIDSSPSDQDSMRHLGTVDVLLRFANGVISLMNDISVLPLGLNSCVSRTLIERIRLREGHVFQEINPDYRFAFSCLLNASELIHFDHAFFVAQGTEVSNGAINMRGDAQKYIESLDLAAPWKDAPIKAPLVHNAIAQDFLAAIRDYGRADILAQWNRSKYYTDCLLEIRIKRNAGILPTSEINELQRAVEMALRNEDEGIRALVTAPLPRRALGKMKSLAKIILGRCVDMLPVNRDGSEPKKNFRTALQAAGFEYL